MKWRRVHEIGVRVVISCNANALIVKCCKLVACYCKLSMNFFYRKKINDLLKYLLSFMELCQLCCLCYTSVTFTFMHFSLGGCQLAFQLLFAKNRFDVCFAVADESVEILRYNRWQPLKMVFSS